jgi:hypothetical protein
MSTDDAINQRLEIARRELLDLTGRNRLLNTQRSSSRSSRLEIIDEISQEVYRHLVIDRKSMSFLSALVVESQPKKVSTEEPSETTVEPSLDSESTTNAETHAIDSESSTPSPSVVVTSNEQLEALDSAFGETELDEPSKHDLPDVDESTETESSTPDENLLPQPDEEEPDARHTDDKLQTPLTSEKLQSRLLKMFYDARTFEEEQGVNIMFLAIGFLKWKETGKDAKERFAPLILVPVSLSRRSAGAKFRIRYNEEEVITNLSLQEKLKVEFDLQLPTISDDEDWTPNDYFAQVELTIAGIDGWELLRNDMVMWFYSFSKFLMYRDLQSENWPAQNSLERHPLIQSLLTKGFQPQPAICDDDAHLDQLLDPLTTIHVTDADSSQSIAIEEVRQGRNLVIQGPPGTGKSQTITNLIGAAVKEGRKVLFVAEKMAALEVVKRRLDALGIGITCLELHSHKASKRAVLRELDETLRLGQPVANNVDALADELRTVRNELNQHAESMCTALEPSSVTPFHAIGELVRLRQRQLPMLEIDLPNARDWDADAVTARLSALRDIVDHMNNIGNPKTHPWRGVGAVTILPSDQKRITAATTELSTALNDATHANESLANALQLSSIENTLNLNVAIAMAQSLVEMPDLDGEAFVNNVWADKRNKIDDLIKQGLELGEVRQKLDGVFADLAWTTDVSDARMAINAHGRSFFLFRIFNRSYRDAMSQFKGILKRQDTATVDERIEWLDLLIAGQDARKNIEADSDRDRVGISAFGKHWQGTSSDFETLQVIANWEAAYSKTASDHPDLTTNRSLLATIDRANLGDLATQARQQIDRWQAQFDQLAAILKLDIAEAFDTPVEDIPFDKLLERISDWSEKTESITHWIDYRRRYQQLNDLELQALSVEIHAGNLPADQVVDQFELTYYDQMTRVAFDRFPHLAEFNGTTHENLLEKFSLLDRNRMVLARREVALVHHDGMPVNASNIGQVGVVRREIQKKRRHLALRRLLRDAGRAVQAIKPVFMMSPTSIAQFLEPGRLQFDLLVIDEASQVPPVDAFGAIARSNQIVVVGDDKQLPPTRFFQRTTDDVSESDSPDDFHAGNMESILSLCVAQNVAQRMLRWHYRSRHHSLIAVSNQEFYNQQLYVIPSPEKNSSELGLRSRYIEDGVFDRGGTATNQIEASAVVEAVMHHAEQFPNRTLGVGTFSVSQRDAVLDELEHCRREHPEFEAFFNSDAYEPFFVKNLENIQGDERDVIFISVGYAKDDSGKLTMNFGPLTNDGGERRLNVLITRARSRCEVFSSIRSSEIDLNRTNARGTKSLKVFLEHAEQNTAASIPSTKSEDETKTLDVETTSSTTDESFETEIANQLNSHGYSTERHVGTTGLYVDVAIEDPGEDDRFFMGIECDGPDYQSARTARDRDRIRFDVLKRQGWHIERVWSIDWLHRPNDQLQRLIHSAKAIIPIETEPTETPTTDESDEQSTGSATSDSADKSVQEKPTSQSIALDESIERIDRDSNLGNPCGVTDYKLADFKIKKSQTLADSANELSDSLIHDVVSRVVEIEGPVHIEELTRRVANLVGLKRVSSRITDVVKSQVDQMLSKAELEEEVEFLAIPDRPVVVRNRSQVSQIRKPELIALAEIRAGVLAIVEVHFGATRDDAIVETARLFGFSATSPQLRERIDGEISKMLASRELVELDGWLHADTVAIINADQESID